jgi:hypothetical protein
MWISGNLQVPIQPDARHASPKGPASGVIPVIVAAIGIGGRASPADNPQTKLGRDTREGVPCPNTGVRKPYIKRQPWSLGIRATSISNVGQAVDLSNGYRGNPAD